MMGKVTKLILAVAALLMIPLASGFIAPTAHAVDPKQAVCEGLNGVSVRGDCAVGGQASISDTIVRIINILSLIAGIAAVIMIIIGGFRYVVSAGDSGGISSAKNTIIYAIVGLIVIALAQLIVRFVIDRVTA